MIGTLIGGIIFLIFLILVNISKQINAQVITASTLAAIIEDDSLFDSSVPGLNEFVGVTPVDPPNYTNPQQYGTPVPTPIPTPIPTSAPILNTSSGGGGGSTRGEESFPQVFSVC